MVVQMRCEQGTKYEGTKRVNSHPLRAERTKFLLELLDLIRV
jgi:hypothetical protein